MTPISACYSLNLSSFPCIPCLELTVLGNNNNGRSRRPGIPGDPRAHQHARRGAAGDASSGAGHLFRSNDRSDPRPAARSLQIVRHQRKLLYLHRQRPWRVGSNAQQRAVARRQGSGAGERPFCNRVGSSRRRHGRGGRSAEGRLAPCHSPGRSRGPPATGQASRDQGDSGRAGRYGLGRLQRHRSDRQGDQGLRSSGAVHGRCRGFARLHALRDGRVGHRRRDVRIAEGADDAAGPGLRRRQRPRSPGA